MESLEQFREVARNEEKAFRNLVPKTGFIGDYMRYTDRQESPGSFHFWVAATLLGGVLQRRAWVSKGMYEVYPSFYTVLVAPSGRCRKSRAIRIGTELVEDFPWMNIIADKTTPEALIEALMVGTRAMEPSTDEEGREHVDFNLDNTGLIRAGELSVFLNRQTYTSGMVGLLTDLSDCPPSFRYITRNRRPVVLRNVMISLIGASTQEWLATSLPEQAFEGGFMSRILFVVRNHRDRSYAFPTAPVQGEKDELRRRLLRIRATVRREVPLSAEARRWFEEWYNAEEDADPIDERLEGYVERKPDTLLKLALILTASDERTVVNLPCLQQCLLILEWTQERMFDAFKHVDLSPLGMLTSRILRFLDYAGRASRREILRKFSRQLPGGIQTLEQVQELLLQAGEIDVVMAELVKGKRPTCVWHRIRSPKDDDRTNTRKG